MFEVLLSDSAIRDLRSNVDWWIVHRCSEESERWYVAIMEAIYSLEHNPQRCTFAREAELLGVELRTSGSVCQVNKLTGGYLPSMEAKSTFCECLALAKTQTI